MSVWCATRRLMKRGAQQPDIPSFSPLWAGTGPSPVQDVGFENLPKAERLLGAIRGHTAWGKFNAGRRRQHRREVMAQHFFTFARD